MRAALAWCHVLAIAVLVLSTNVAAQTLYKWVDQDGKVHYADRPPVGFKGEVTRIEADAVPDVAPRPPPAAPAKRQVEDEGKEKAPDPATRRRQQRELLAARLTAARDKVEAARKALAEGEGAGEDEKQFVHETFRRDERRPERTPPPRSNCMSSTSSGGTAEWNCPRQVPNDAYFERQGKLEEAVRQAEEELADAERAYRRGVD